MYARTCTITTVPANRVIGANSNILFLLPVSTGAPRPFGFSPSHPIVRNTVLIVFPVFFAFQKPRAPPQFSSQVILFGNVSPGFL